MLNFNFKFSLTQHHELKKSVNFLENLNTFLKNVRIFFITQYNCLTHGNILCS